MRGVKLGLKDKMTLQITLVYDELGQGGQAEACSLAISSHLVILLEEKTSKVFMVGIERGLCHAFGITQKP
jgi:hypothetical protein